jgi:hypothetical protein
MSSRKEILQRFLSAQDRLVFQASDLSLGTIAEMVERKAIDVSPSYQRRERWSQQKQSALIESFLLNVPVPAVYLAEDNFGQYSVVDGKQRITAIHRFVRNQFVLSGLETFKEIEGLKFSGLPEDMQNALVVRPYLRVITLLKQSDSTLKFEVFTRLNRGGETMAAQELRNVAYRGPLNDLIYALAENEFLKQQLKIRSERSTAYQLMTDAEYVLRFLTLRSSWRKFSGNYRTEMDNFMRQNQDASDAKQKEYSQAFNVAIGMCQKIWGNEAFKRPTADGWRDQLLAGMYDAEMVAAEHVPSNVREAAAKRSKWVKERTRKLFDDEQFEQAVRQGTNTPARISFRIQKIIELLYQANH